MKKTGCSGIITKYVIRSEKRKNRLQGETGCDTIKIVGEMLRPFDDAAKRMIGNR
ncbi:MAG: hypothetical protein LIO99_04815 [Clostridiales bacterium]|nr:hypothetical protein [Clostridiales bacterium]